ncbi:MAG TPA: hypothetical protein VMU90_05610 [Solirubrobacteraceae bacterium]|nr:hypothetical protein [Solirubrobacteraceae bacterium]
MLTVDSKLHIGRRMLGVVACAGMTLGITACTSDPTKLTCKDLNSSAAAVNVMAQAAMENPAFSPYINPSNNFGGGGQAAVGAGIDESGLSSEFKNQIAALCAGANPNTQPYQTALGNTESFAQTGARTPAPSNNSTPDPNQGSGGSNSGSGSSQDPNANSDGPSGSAASAAQSSGSGGSTGPPNGSSGAGSSGPVDNGSSGSASSGSSGSQPSGSQGAGSAGSGSAGSNSSSSQGNGNLTLPPCGPAQHCNW